MSRRKLMVPIHVDGLHLKTGRMVLGPQVDYRHLPYVGRDAGGVARDVSFGLPYLATTVNREPMAGESTWLAPGVHLHWAIPPGLAGAHHPLVRDRGGKTREDRGRVVFLRVPNRWLVVRAMGNVIEQRWLVESDYLWPHDHQFAPGGTDPESLVSYPYRDPAEPFAPPWRYLGRSAPIPHGKTEPRWETKKGGHLAELTCEGPGDLHFPHFYPGCRSVFGLHDPKYSAGAPAQLRYEVFGWYAEEKTDAYGEVLGRFAPDPDDGDPYGEQLAEWLEDRLGWSVDPKGLAKKTWPRRLLCYGRLRAPALLAPAPARAGKVRVVVGNTPTEALAAWLGRELSETPLVDRGAVFRAAGLGKLLVEKKKITAEQLRQALARQKREGGGLGANLVKMAAIEEKDLIAFLEKQFPGRTIDLARTEDLVADAGSGWKIWGTEDPVEGCKRQRAWLEDVIESALYSDDAGARRLDLGAWFRNMRQRNGFHPVEGNSIWMVRREPRPKGTEPLTDARLGELLVADKKITAEQLQQALEQQKKQGGRLGAVLVAGKLIDKSALHAFLERTSSRPLALPAELAEALNRLNAAQEAYDRGARRVDALRRRLAADWHRVMLHANPPVDNPRDWSDARADADLDTMREWLRERRLRPLVDAALAAGVLVMPDAVGEPPAGATVLADSGGEWSLADPGRAPSLAGRVGKAVAEVAAGLAAHGAAGGGAAAGGDGDRWRLLRTPGPRFHRPNDPVVLVHGLPATPADRTGEDGEGGPLRCTAVAAGEVDVEGLDQAKLAAARRWLDAHEAAGHGGFRKHPRPVPHPLFLEWQAELAPVRRGSGLAPSRETYRRAFIRDTWRLGETDAELHAEPDVATITERLHTIKGRGFLSGHARRVTADRLKQFLERRLRPFIAAHPEAAGDEGIEWLAAHAPEVEAWLEAQPHPASLHPELDENDHPHVEPAVGALAAWHALRGQPPCLTQSLHGFHDALLMRRPMVPLDLDDPLGFSASRDFCRRQVAPAVADARYSAPVLTADFVPIRGGDMTLTGLRLVDTFGQPQEVPVDRIVTTSQLAGPRVLGVSLPPRLAQAARLDFRWLAGDGDAFELNSHPAVSPVCGWLLPEVLDGRVMVYDAAGGALGSIDQTGRWRTPPGGGGVADAVAIANPHLRRVVRWLLREGAERPHLAGKDPRAPALSIRDFVDVLESALENISPAAAHHHPAQALLMGRPIAVVRALAGVELAEPPALDLSADALAYEVDRWRDDRLHGRATPPPEEDPRLTHGFDRVELPIRIGEHMQLDDGVVGYWVEEGDGFRDDRFHAPQSVWVRDRDLDVYRRDDGPVLAWNALSEGLLRLTLLVDPRAGIHASCGLLPARELALPGDQVHDALRRISVSFLTSPLLTGAGGPALPLPLVEGCDWSWVDLVDGRWEELYRQPSIDCDLVLRSVATETDAAPGGKSIDVWQELLDAGWLKPIAGRPDRARIVAREDRAEKQLPAVLADRAERIGRLLDVAGRSIREPSADAHYPPGQHLREGWLVLRPNERGE